jgi:hypothetical protein
MVEDSLIASLLKTKLMDNGQTRPFAAKIQFAGRQLMRPVIYPAGLSEVFPQGVSSEVM